RAWSFFDIAATVPLASRSSSSFKRSSRLRIVRKFVSVPPSQRSVTYGIPVRRATLRTASRAERLVPTERAAHPSGAASLGEWPAAAHPRGARGLGLLAHRPRRDVGADPLGERERAQPLRAGYPRRPAGGRREEGADLLLPVLGAVDRQHLGLKQFPEVDSRE